VPVVDVPMVDVPVVVVLKQRRSVAWIARGACMPSELPDSLTADVVPCVFFLHLVEGASWQRNTCCWWCCWWCFWYRGPVLALAGLESSRGGTVGTRGSGVWRLCHGWEQAVAARMRLREETRDPGQGAAVLCMLCGPARLSDLCVCLLLVLLLLLLMLLVLPVPPLPAAYPRATACWILKLGA
jgi:hypothetical protein